MKLLSVEDVQQLVRKIGVKPLLHQISNALEKDLRRWESFQKSPRHATHVPGGVLELMPCADEEFHSFKYVNGHPNNVALGLLGIVAYGALADTETGFPIMLCEMTLLTAMRTAAVAALGVRYMARENSHVVAIIGTGAQAEFQIQAIANERQIDEVRYFDIDPKAMKKFATNLDREFNALIACTSIEEVLRGSDIVITATAAKKKAVILDENMALSGTHIHALGGDCPGKTELSTELTRQSKIVVEFLPQSQIEGEIQNTPEDAVHAELWELAQGSKPGREDASEITMLDAVGFALEDFSILKLFHNLSEEYGIGNEIDLIAYPEDPKDLYSMVS